MFWTLLATLVVLLCGHFAWKCSYWRRHGVRGPCGLPLLGNMWQFFLGRKHYGAVYEQIYNAFPSLPYIGIYRLFNEPAVLVRSQDMLKEIMIRSFQHFQDNVLWIDPQRDPSIYYYNPFVARGEQWRHMRTEFMPIFTPNKVKASFPHIKSVCEKLAAYVAQTARTSNCYEAKDLFSKYTLDVVASAAYGLDAASFTNENSDFTQLVEPLFQQNSWSLLETTALLFSPTLGNFIKYHYVPTDVQKWLRAIIEKVLARRLQRSNTDADLDLDVDKSTCKSTPNDFLQWLLEAKRRQNASVDAQTIVGHCSTFLLEGFETSSSLMAFALYEYARHPDVQQRVQQEIDAVLVRHGGTLCYEALQEMPYLEASLLETLRRYPPMMALLKHCTKTFELPPQVCSGRRFKVPEGMVFIIPVKAVHFDSDLYPEPLKFKPERFLSQSEKQRGCAFLGFGEGPRMCPGMRFGLAQSKAGLVTLLSKYTAHLTENAKPFELSTTTFLTATQNGIWISFQERK